MKLIKVGLGTCGISAGGESVYRELLNSAEENHLDVRIVETGCMGRCYDEVLVEVIDDSKESYLYANVTPEKAKKIVSSHIIGNTPVDEWIVIQSNESNKDGLLFNKQKRIVLRNCGDIDPQSIDEYISRDGYKALDKVLNEYSQSGVIDIIIKSGLRGRGGAGFLTGMKWKFAHEAISDKKYIICNADEGDPGAFMDRSVLE